MTDSSLEDRESKGTEAETTGSKGNWEGEAGWERGTRSPDVGRLQRADLEWGRKSQGDEWGSLFFMVAGSKNRSGSDCPITRGVKAEARAPCQKHRFKEIQALGWGETRDSTRSPAALRHNFC